MIACIHSLAGSDIVLLEPSNIGSMGHDVLHVNFTERPHGICHGLNYSTSAYSVSSVLNRRRY